MKIEGQIKTRETEQKWLHNRIMLVKKTAGSGEK